jgi:hypothetical protein
MSVVAGTHAMQTRSLTGKLWLPLCSIPSHSDRSTKVAGCCIERADPMPQWRGSPSPLDLSVFVDAGAGFFSGNLRRISLQHRSFAHLRGQAGGPSFETVLIFRVAAPSRVSKGRRIWFFFCLFIRTLRRKFETALAQSLLDCSRFCNCESTKFQQDSTEFNKRAANVSTRII